VVMDDNDGLRHFLKERENLEHSIQPL